MTILAVACDGKAECWKDEDEKNCKRDEIEILLGERNYFHPYIIASLICYRFHCFCSHFLVPVCKMWIAPVTEDIGQKSC